MLLENPPQITIVRNRVVLLDVIVMNLSASIK